MNLPNFINFEPFNKLRRQMRVSNLGRFSIHGSDAPDAAPPEVKEAVSLEVTTVKHKTGAATTRTTRKTEDRKTATGKSRAAPRSGAAKTPAKAKTAAAAKPPAKAAAKPRKATASKTAPARAAAKPRKATATKAAPTKGAASAKKKPAGGAAKSSSPRAKATSRTAKRATKP